MGTVLCEADVGAGAVTGEGSGGVAVGEFGTFAVVAGTLLDRLVAELLEVLMGLACVLVSGDFDDRGLGVAGSFDAKTDLGSVGTGVEGVAVVGPGGGEAVVFAQFGHVTLGGFVE